MNDKEVWAMLHGQFLAYVLGRMNNGFTFINENQQPMDPFDWAIMMTNRTIELVPKEKK